MNNLPILKIRADKPTGLHARVWLNDVEIENWLRSIKFNMGVDSITTATLELVVRPDIEIPADVLASVTVLGEEGADEDTP